MPGDLLYAVTLQDRNRMENVVIKVLMASPKQIWGYGEL